MSDHIDTRPDALAARADGENFPVASRLLPKDVRSSLMAVYAFARLADEIGDESPGDRLAELDWLDEELARAAVGSATDPVLQRLTPVLADLDVGVDPFHRLIDANRMDQRVARYQTFADLVRYCELSAVPVGRIVLSVFQATSPARVRLSDEVCIGLQLVEHLQDIGEDAARGRVYLPREDMACCGCTEDDLVLPAATLGLRRVVAMECARARGLLASGRPLAATLPMRPRVAVVGFSSGGLAALDAIDRAHGDVLSTRCRPSRLGFARRAIAGVVAASANRIRGAT